MIRIYRKAKRTAKPNKAKREAVADALALSRIARPNVVELFTSGDFHRLPVVPPHVIKNPALRRRDHLGDGWIVPTSDYGRGAREESKLTQQLLLFIVRYFVETGVIDRDEYAIVVDPD